MSNSNRPFGNNHSSDFHDPLQDARTDAPPSDADALDAWLNGIASHSGSSGTRSGNGQRRPNARIDDHDATGDTASMIVTASRFHQRIEEAQSRDARAAEPDPQLWETIMERTPRPAPKLVSTAEATANPWVAQPDTRQSQPPGPERRSRPRISNQQRIWNTVANIALVVAILLAGFGIWRLSGEPGLPSGSNGDVPTAPGFAMQASPPAESPVPNEPDEVVVPPVSTPAPTTDCDFSEDIPIFNGVDESPWDGTAVLLTTTGDLVLTCPEEPGSTVLASDVEHAASLDWPGFVTVDFENVDADAESRYSDSRAVLNIITGDMIRIGTRPSGYLDLNQHPGSPWLVAPNVEFQGEWSIIDLRTMEEKRLADYEPNQLNGQPASFIHDVTTSANGNDDTLVIANQFSNTYGGGIIDPNSDVFHELATSNVAMQYGPLINSDIPGSLLILNGTLNDARWLSLPRKDQTYIDIQLSPDGEYLALTSVEGELGSHERDPGGNVRGSILYSIMRLSDGAEIVQSPPTADQAEEYGTEMLWLTDSSGLAYTHDGDVHVLPTEPNAEPYTLYEGNDALRALQPTTDPTRIIVRAMPLNDMATAELRAGTPHVLSISTAGDETYEMSGHITHDFSGLDHLQPATRFMVLVQFEESGAQTTTYHLVDVVTGDVLEEIETTVDVAGMGKGAITSTFDGEATIVSFGAQDIYAMRVVEGVVQVREVAPPEILGNPTGSVGVLVSSDGSTAFVGQNSAESFTVAATSLESETGTWTPVPGYPVLVPGTGD